MAEERLIDDDKDRKYKIRINEDGEEELVIDDTPEEEPKETIDFEVPDLAEDDEEAAVMTPEQLAARERQKIEAEERRIASLNEHCAHAHSLIAEGKFEDALYVIEEAKELERADGRIADLELKAVTKNFTDFSKPETENGACGIVRQFADETVKESFGLYRAELVKKSEALKAEVDGLNAENEEKKAERRTVYLKKRKTAGIAFCASAVPLIIFAVLAIYFSTVMHSTLGDYTYMILFFVFLGLAGVSLIATLVTAHKLWESARLLKRNKSNLSTKLGREYEAKNAELKFMQSVIDAYGENK